MLPGEFERRVVEGTASRVTRMSWRRRSIGAGRSVGSCDPHWGSRLARRRGRRSECSRSANLADRAGCGWSSGWCPIRGSRRRAKILAAAAEHPPYDPFVHLVVSAYCRLHPPVSYPTTLPSSTQPMLLRRAVRVRRTSYGAKSSVPARTVKVCSGMCWAGPPPTCSAGGNELVPPGVGGRHE